MGERRGREFWRGALGEYEASGLTLAAFAAGRELNVNTLSWWRWKLRSERQSGSEAVGFVEVASPALPVVVPEARGAARAVSCMTLRVGSGVLLAFDGLPPAEYVAAVAHSYDGGAP